eukprot:Sspe_Gene.30519::Locus_15093_Transcript_7_10_Confidence_0.545_Length_2104::g.30519::m.30519
MDNRTRAPKSSHPGMAAALLQKHRERNIDIQTVQYVLGICGGNVQLADEQLGLMSTQQLEDVARNLSRDPCRLTPSQTRRCDEFCSIVGCDVPTASRFLSQNAWDLQVALNSFFQSGHSFEPPPAQAPAEKSDLDDFFEQCKGYPSNEMALSAPCFSGLLVGGVAADFLSL